MITWVILNQLARSSRPGDMHLPARKKEVIGWINDAKALGIRSIICLLSKEELHDYYFYVGIDLFELYRAAGFEIAYHPLSEYDTPPVPYQFLSQIGDDYHRMPKPCLVHCKAGVNRTGAVIKHLLRPNEAITRGR